MDIRYLANTVVITSDMEMDDVVKAFNIDPKAGTLTDAKGNETFKLDVNLGCEMPLNKFGAVFNTVNDGKAAIKINIPPCIEAEDKKSYIAEALAPYWGNLQLAIAALKGILENNATIVADIESLITE